MIGFLKRMLSGDDARATTRPYEEIAKSKLPTELGIEVLTATPLRRARVLSIKDHLSFVPRDQMFDLVDRIMARFALYVWDLPASERDHHCDPFGLLDHSLEVASLTVSELSGSAFQVSPDPLIDHQERPGWTYAAFLSAIFHDIGKVLDVEVRLPGTGRPWDSTREPLGAYVTAARRTTTGADHWTHRPGRGLDGHQDRNSELMGPILTPQARDFLGSRLKWIDALFRARTKEEIARLTKPARRIKTAYGSIDHSTSKQDSIDRCEAAHSDSPSPPCTEEIGNKEPAEPLAAETPTAPVSEVARTEAAPSDIDTIPYHPVRRTRTWKGRSKPDRDGASSWLDRELNPVTFVETIRTAIVSSRLRINVAVGECYVTSEHIWIVLPSALKRLARFLRFSPNERVQTRMVRSLTESDQALKCRPGEVRWRIRPHSGDFVITAAGLLHKGILSDADLDKIGIWTRDLAADAYPAEDGERDTSKRAS